VSTGTTAEELSIDVAVRDGHTVVTVAGTRDAAVIVRSDAGEEIYLPPENFDRAPGEGSSGQDGPYASAPPADSPYERQPAADTPYESVGDRGPGPGPDPDGGSDAEGRDGSGPTLGTQPTADGFRVVHPEPVRDVRVVR
jgi:hypothetical protein